MIHTTIRFLGPVDPRKVFDVAVTLVNPVPNAAPEHQSPGSAPMHPGDWWPLNPRIWFSNQGDTHFDIAYGNEGSLLIEEWDAYPQFADEYPPEQRGPRAYVAIRFEGSGGSAYEKHGPDGLFAQEVAHRFLHVAKWLQDDYTGTWTPLLWRGAGVRR